MTGMPRVRGAKWFAGADYLTDECRRKTERLVTELVAERGRSGVSVEPAPYIGPDCADMMVNVCHRGSIHRTVWRDGFSR